MPSITFADVKKWDTIIGVSGNQYTKQGVINSKYRFVSGVYVIASEDTVLYVGQASCLGLRIIGHPKKTTAEKQGFKNIVTYVLATDDRLAIEKHLIHTLAPIYNVKYNLLKNLSTI